MDVGVVTNVMAAVLVGSLGLTDRESYHGVAITALFLYFILSAVLTLR